MKNMKLYKKALLILSLGLTLNSCLDLDPQDQLADGNLWGAADDFKYFATNFYGWTVISSLLFLMVHILTGVRT